MAKKHVRLEREFAGKTLILETGKLANMAGGSVTITHGDMMCLVATTLGEARDGMDFFPLSVDFQDRFYASGKIKGSRFIKREGRPPESAILTSRLIDRPMRPMFPKGMRNSVQVIITMLSTDSSCNMGPLSMSGVSLGFMMGGMPFQGPVAGVRVGRVDGNLILNPTYQEVEDGDFELIVAGTPDSITMVESGAKQVSAEDMLAGLEFAHKYIKELCEMQKEFMTEYGEVEKVEYTAYEIPADIKSAVAGAITGDMMETLYVAGKKEFGAAKKVIQESVLEKFAAEIERDDDPWAESDVKEAIDYVVKTEMRKEVLASERRLDGRGLADVRTVTAEVGMLPRAHGSGLFNRGATQVLTVAALGGPSDAQIVDEMDISDGLRTYIHYYTFAPFSVGEARPLRSAGRREIGHGMLAERALMPVLPPKEDFPYTMLLVSETLTCNGSSSMAAVCGSTLALMDAGVPIAAPVVGVAMGLIIDEETGKYKILSDIQAQEDFLGDMDFKVAGTGHGITALQLDTKVKGLKMSLLAEALTQAKAAQGYIWGEMEKAIAGPRPELNQYAPLIIGMMIDPDDIGKVIGKGGETIQGMTKDFGVDINIEDDGKVTITAPDQESGAKAKHKIEQITYKPQVGDEFDGKVVRIMDFGAFVEFSPGIDGLVHISKLSKERVNKVEDVVKIGDPIKVKLLKVDEQGRYNLQRMEG
ncbi:polyribonucleotide nucleotidyltransferase [Candidatus Peregrinibacteria bacterium]|jgi:polyribonucleotide nucleotidyltransferase|nr:polyribonucleotide nucleotidyltransferase [Candidatus Peregrinibacteria bacterium]